MVGHNLMAMLAIGQRWKAHRLLAMHYHHGGVMPSWQWRLIYRVAALRFQCIFYPSAFIMREALAIAPFLSSTARLIDNPFPIPLCPTSKEKREARDRLNVPIDAKIVGNAGWLISRKRWDIFLKVAAQVALKNTNAFFLIAGDGPERSKLETQAHVLGLHERIRWLGWQKDLSDLYKSLDVLLFNSDWDAMPRAPLEAMSYAVPVVASVLHGGTSEMISGDSVGVCLPEHDVEKLADHVLRFLADEGAAQRVGNAGREKVLAAGDPKRYADRMLQALGC